MDRRVSGGLMLVLALVSVLVVPRLLNPPVIDGRAAVAPPPPPPSVGDCIKASLDGYSTDASGRVFPSGPAQFVPCTEPHGSEIFYLQADVALAPADPAASSVPSDAVITHCSTPGTGNDPNAYLGAPAVPQDDWQPALNFGVSLLGPSSQQFAAGQNWLACTLVVAGGGLRDTLHGIYPRTGGAPPEFGSCADGEQDAASFYRQTLCTQPHAKEFLAYRSLAPGAPDTQSELDAQCRAIAAAATGRGVLAGEPGVAVTTRTYALDQATQQTQQVTAPLPAGAEGFASCSIEATDGRQWTKSLRLIGDAPLPWKT